MLWNLDHTYLTLPGLFSTVQDPTPGRAPVIRVFNQALADRLGLGSPSDADPAILGGTEAPAGSRPFAQAYAGHQYGHFTMLGDGRALVLGEHRTPSGTLVDLQLKGSGPTPYSRRGDGRATLGPMLREYLMGEAMHSLGIPTTRGLAVVTTGETVWREGPLPGAVLTRVAASHLRVGTFEFAAASGEPGALEALLNYAIGRHAPQAAEAECPAAAFLATVIESQARLVAQWMAVGFVHGVMNTDNMAISGETLDYGPCAFLDAYGPGQVFSSIDRHGRYAYGNQPAVAGWNLTRLAEALLPLIHPDPETALASAQALIDSFAGRFQGHYLTLMASKLGLSSNEGGGDLVEGLLGLMEESKADYTGTFRALTDSLADPEGPKALRDAPGFGPWYRAWKAALAREPSPAACQARMAGANPVYIPRNHRVEEALAAAVAGDDEPFEALVRVVSRPFDRRDGLESYESPPEPGSGWDEYTTFCGT